VRKGETQDDRHLKVCVRASHGDFDELPSADVSDLVTGACDDDNGRGYACEGHDASWYVQSSDCYGYDTSDIDGGIAGVAGYACDDDIGEWQKEGWCNEDVEYGEWDGAGDYGYNGNV